MLFSCATDSPRDLIRVISPAVYKQHNQLGVLEVDEHGFRFEVNDNSSVSMNIVIPAAKFTSYCFVEANPVRMTINLSKFLSCLKIFSNSSFETIIRAKDLVTIEVEISATMSSAMCFVRTLVPLPKINFPPIIAEFNATIQTSALYELFKLVGAPHEIAIRGYSTNKALSITTKCAFGDTSAELKNGIGDFRGLGDEINSSYSFHSFIPLVKSLWILSGKETLIHISKEGILEVQINTGDTSEFKLRIEPQAINN
ncbi:hypothetical protein TVAG_296060 [Trichomonas vaginalis G3]|uniref:Proliferating cell nuclear antigen n=1 Tax=Trichomonas vaginalis (strain ATCC PRA-98 / G3) TaxID=412133 RepID=A2FW81_TRIV3|nr:cell cycle checkpoint protein RAD1 family [Trichomonas vaginalis G3]EAX90836.1 hypothetical protein TVAG_296060 [Trichomonas vaginalis G3]KAI5531038.1 cell cycle checkpoint protein RAD1 family [Trichomonas vaginalis G3]|eukprot:XP_001303766.1 hypothetical protein [Trichomonas vaginalis G3]